MPAHGTRGGYASGCRCDECRAFNAAYSREYRRRHRKPRATRSDKGIKRVPVPHGTRSGYSHHGCRCHECRAAAALDNRKWREANLEASNAYQGAYRRANPDKIAGYSAARAAAPYTPAALTYRDLILGDPCVYCGDTATTVDHIVPVSRGGLSDWDNLAPACRSCNPRKATKPLLLFLLNSA